MLTLNNNRLYVHLTCVCRTTKYFHLYRAGVQNDPRQHFILSTYLGPFDYFHRQGHACRAADVLFSLQLFTNLLAMYLYKNGTTNRGQPRCKVCQVGCNTLSTVLRLGTHVLTIRLCAYPYTTLKIQISEKSQRYHTHCCWPC